MEPFAKRAAQNYGMANQPSRVLFLRVDYLLLQVTETPADWPTKSV
jgi:hypothetical protein